MSARFRTGAVEPRPRARRSEAAQARGWIVLFLALFIGFSITIMIAGKLPVPQDIAVEPSGIVFEQYEPQALEQLSSYGWVDQSQGKVRIPIERAKELTVERGLPTRPQAAGQQQP